MNRPVHLARSNAFIEKARNLFQDGMGKAPQKRRIQLIESSLYYLQSALEHASLAAKSTKTRPGEESFMVFIRMVMICIYSARILLDNEIQLADSKSPLWQFLHRCDKTTQTVKFARSGEQLLEDAGHLFKLSREPAEDLRQTLLENMNDEERARYRLAYEGLNAYLARSRPVPRAERFFRIFSQAPEMKNE